MCFSTALRKGSRMRCQKACILPEVMWPLSKVPVHAEPEAAGPDPGVIIERQGPTLECFKTRLNAGSALLILRQQGPTLRCFLGLNADPDSGLELRGPKPGIAVNVAECSRQKYNADPDSGPES
eukprot:1161040-Pelagomonas_calceolata.AAC.9